RGVANSGLAAMTTTGRPNKAMIKRTFSMGSTSARQRCKNTAVNKREETFNETSAARELHCSGSRAHKENPMNRHSYGQKIRRIAGGITRHLPLVVLALSLSVN